jgi:ABC-2 type transport system permease protein
MTNHSSSAMAASQPALQVRSGFVHWLRSYALMVLWESKSLRLILPVAMVVQVLIGAGLVFGFGFLMGEVSTVEALYLATGVTVISMITLGFALAPQIIAAQKQAGIYDYMWSLPVPRTTTVAAGLTVHSMIAVPGMILALLVAVWRFDLTLTISPLVLPGAMLTLITAASVGFALAHAIPKPMVTHLITQVLVFVILLYSPINFPPDRLPEWMATIHAVLPFQHAATVMRACLTEGLVANVGPSFTVLGAWALVSWIITAWVVGRRP